MKRATVSSGTPWENTVGYSRALRVGNLVFVSGTTASLENGTTVAVGDVYGQTQFVTLAWTGWQASTISMRGIGTSHW